MVAAATPLPTLSSSFYARRPTLPSSSAKHYLHELQHLVAAEKLTAFQWKHIHECVHFFAALNPALIHVAEFTEIVQCFRVLHTNNNCGSISSSSSHPPKKRIVHINCRPHLQLVYPSSLHTIVEEHTLRNPWCTQHLGQMSQYDLADLICVESHLEQEEEEEEKASSPASQITSLFPLVATAMLQLAPDGYLIVRNHHDTTHTFVTDIVFWLSTMFEECILCKPSSSTISSLDVTMASPSTFIVCKRFLNNIPKPDLFRTIKCMFDQWHVAYPQDIRRLFANITYPLLFQTKIDEINTVFLQQHIEMIQTTICAAKTIPIDDTLKLDTLRQKHFRKCAQWCEKTQLCHEMMMLMTTS